jgi:hypothetical protein
VARSKGRERPILVRNPGTAAVFIPHEEDPARFIHVPPGRTVEVRDPGFWRDSANFRAAFQRCLIVPAEVGAPVAEEALPPELTGRLSAHQLHTAEVMVYGPEETALSLIQAVPEPEAAEGPDGLDRRGRTFLIQEHLPVLEAALFLEQRAFNRPERVALLKERIERIKKLAFAENVL